MKEKLFIYFLYLRMDHWLLKGKLEDLLSETDASEKEK